VKQSRDWVLAERPRYGQILGEPVVAMVDVIKDRVARRLELPVDQVFGGQKLSEVLAASPTAINSIDLLDAFAGALADQGLGDGIELPAFTLDHSATDVIDALGSQLASAA
jgi:hypothetical protein